MKAKKESEILEFLLPYAESIGLEIIEVSFKASKNPQLTIYIDKEDGVDLDTCEKFHNLINEPLDTFDPCDVAYTLNVSSPGIDRPLKTPRDFERKMNKQVEVKLYAPLKGKKYFEGKLVGYDGKSVVINVNNEEIEIALSAISKINEAVIFD